MPYDPNIVFNPAPDPLERKVRLVCGGLMGLLIAFVLCVKLGPFSAIATIVVGLASVVTCALCALRYGDRFWHGVSQALRGLLL